MLLTGTFQRTIDEKRRVAIPKPLREAIGFPDTAVLYVAPGTDGSLALYTEEAFSRLADQVASGSPTGSDLRAFSRLFYGLSQRVEIDRQGRIRLPAELAQMAQLAGDAVLLGVRDHMELWSQAAWDAYRQSTQEQYDQIAERAFHRTTNNL